VTEQFALEQAVGYCTTIHLDEGTALALTSDELKRRERENLRVALAQTGGKVFGPTGAAALLGMKPTTVISRIKALGLERNKPT
jgi:transcriptional regulator with GAF, ATPase, and Fis domain